MPYPAHPITEAQTAATAYLNAKTRFEANKNILKSGALKKEMETLGTQLKAVLDTDIAGIRHVATEHFTNVDHWLGNATGTLARAKDSHARWEQNPNEHDAEMITAGAATCEQIARSSAQDANDFGQCWFQHRTYNCTSADKKYTSNYLSVRNSIIDEGKGFTLKVNRISSLHHEALTLRNLLLSQQHANSLILLEKNGAAAELFRSIEHVHTANFVGTRTVQAAAGNCEFIHDAAQNPRLKKEGDLKFLESMFLNLSTLRKGFMMGLDSMNKMYQTGIRQFDQNDLTDPEIKKHLDDARTLINENRVKVQYVDNGYKNAMSDMTKIRGILKK